LLSVQRLGRGYAWFDTGTHESLLEAAEFVRTIEMRQDLKIACVEEVAYHMGYIDRERLMRLARHLGGGDYARYLERLPAIGS
jgi:glucose-1-phosphate thymidylyltransferase